MYSRYFGLKQPAFSIAPDPRYLFMSERHREALAHLLYGVRGGGGFVLLTGEIGAGKTTVCRCFLEQIPKRCNVAYIFNPKLTVEELLRSVCDEFRIPAEHRDPGPATVKDYVDALNEFLLRTHAVGQNNVLIIDEAQNLSADVLEQLRLLTNLETTERKLLQIVLIGQPELRAMLARPNLQQLAQRVIARYHLDALSESETEQYVRHRLAVAGLTRAIPFDSGALQRVFHHSRGVPRRINLLCDRSLLGAYATGKSSADRAIVDQAAGEVFDAPPAEERRRPWLERTATVGLGVIAGAALMGMVALAVDRSQRPAQPAAAAVVADPLAASAAAPLSDAKAREASAETKPVTVAADAPALTPFDLSRSFESLLPSEGDAWRELAAQWRLDAASGDPCAAARRQQVFCYRSSNSTLALIRQLDRPGIITLRDGSNRSAYAILSGLSQHDATLRIGDVPRSVPLMTLAEYWRGEFATFWRVPPEYAGSISDSSSGQAARWLALQLATARGEPAPLAGKIDDGALRSGIYAFQLAQGLPADGVAGPVTLMQLNRVIGVDEPHLSAGR